MDSYIRYLWRNSSSSSASPRQINIVDDNVSAALDSINIRMKCMAELESTIEGDHDGSGGHHGGGVDSDGSNGSSGCRNWRLPVRHPPMFRSASMDLPGTAGSLNRMIGNTATPRRKSRWESMTSQATPRRNNSDSALGKPTRRSSVTEEDLATAALKLRWALEEEGDEEDEDESRISKGSDVSVRSGRSQNTTGRKTTSGMTAPVLKPKDEYQVVEVTTSLAELSSSSSRGPMDVSPPCKPRRRNSSDSLAKALGEAVDVVDGVFSDSSIVGTKSTSSSLSPPSLPAVQSEGSSNDLVSPRKRGPSMQGSYVEIPESLRELPYSRGHSVSPPSTPGDRKAGDCSIGGSSSPGVVVCRPND